MSIHETRLKVKRTLRLNVFDGASVFAMAGFTQNFITPFALALKATTTQIGLLSSFPGFATALSQLATPTLVNRAGSRKAVILPVVLVQALMWLPMFLLPYFLRSSGVWWLIGLFTVGGVFGAMANAPWGSMMADLVREDIRGRYFSFRGRINTFTFLASSLIAGLLLQLFTGNVFVGFAIIFAGAMLFRLLSFYFLSKMYEPPLTKEKPEEASLGRMIATLGRSNVGKFTIFVALIYFAMMLSGPFFSVYMLRDLKLSYLTFTLINASSTVTTVIFLPFWGRRADRAGNLRILKITGFLLPVIPLLWLVSANPVYLIFANAFGGFVWAGFDLSCGNFLFDASAPETRTRQIAVFNSVVNVTLSLGALTGGYLAPHLPSMFGSQLRTLFTLSAILRAAIVILVLHTIIEVRHVPGMSTFRVLIGRAKRVRSNGRRIGSAQ